MLAKICDFYSLPMLTLVEFIFTVIQSNFILCKLIENGWIFFVEVNEFYEMNFPKFSVNNIFLIRRTMFQWWRMTQNVWECFDRRRNKWLVQSVGKQLFLSNVRSFECEWRLHIKFDNTKLLLNKCKFAIIFHNEVIISIAKH